MSLKNRIIGLATVGAAGLALAPAAMACDAPAAPVLAPWGDNALYSLVDGGDFEAGASGWSLNATAHVVSDLNDEMDVAGVEDDYALSLGPGGSATTPPVCVTKDSPHFRFFSSAAGRSFGANLRVEVLYSDGGRAKRYDMKSPRGESVLSPEVSTGVEDLVGETTIRIRFSAINLAPVRVDNVYMDPRML